MKKRAKKNVRELNVESPIIDNLTTPELVKTNVSEVTPDYKKQFTLIIVLIAMLFGVLVVAYFVYSSINSFDYVGTTFNKIKYGNIQMYHTIFPLYHSVTGSHVADFNLYLRNDPRTLESIPFPDDFELTRVIVLTGDLDNITCPENGIAFGNVANAFKNIWQIPVVANTSLHCSANLDNTYFTLRIANETKIEKSTNNCYTVYIKECAVLNATERIIVGSIAKANGY